MILFTFSFLCTCNEQLRRPVNYNYYRDFWLTILPVVPPPPITSDNMRLSPAQVQCAQTSEVTFLSRLRKPVAGLLIPPEDFPGCRLLISVFLSVCFFVNRLFSRWFSLTAWKSHRTAECLYRAADGVLKAVSPVEKLTNFYLPWKTWSLYKKMLKVLIIFHLWALHCTGKNTLTQQYGLSFCHI